MLNLPDVTLIMVETKVHDLARVALDDALARVNFGGALVYTDRPELFEYPAVRRVPPKWTEQSDYSLVKVEPAVRVIQVPDWPDKLKAEAFYYMESQQAATTSHALMYQWDAGVRDVNCWTDDFLAYDYIGAPWPGKRGGQWTPKPGFTVGNGGFTLMSKRLSDFLYANRERLRVQTDMDLSYRAREECERAGMKWAPEDVAYRFAFEHGDNAQRYTPSFGYHDVFNWHLALPQAEVIRRARLMMENPYVRQTTKLSSLNNACPYVQQAIGIEYIHASNRMPPRSQRIGNPRLLGRPGVKA